MSGPCAKRRVWAVLTTRDGREFIGQNDCDTPVVACPRAEGEGYEKCKSICHQQAHAEINALRKAGKAARGANIRIIGHDHCCDDCVKAMQEAGIAAVDFVTPLGLRRQSPWSVE